MRSLMITLKRYKFWNVIILWSCNYYLHRLKFIDSPLYSFRKRDHETLDHLFVQCHCVKEPWCEIHVEYETLQIQRIWKILARIDDKLVMIWKYRNKSYIYLNVIWYALPTFLCALSLSLSLSWGISHNIN